MKFTIFFLFLCGLMACGKGYESWRNEQASNTLEGDWRLVSIATEDRDGQLLTFAFYPSNLWKWTFAPCDPDTQTYCNGFEYEMDTLTNLPKDTLAFQFQIRENRTIFERNNVDYTIQKLTKHKFIYYIVDSINSQKTIYELAKL